MTPTSLVDAGKILGLVQVFVGLLIIALAIPMILRRVGMNPIYGVRIPKAFESESNWYAINAYGGKVLVLAGAIVGVVGLAAFVWPPSSEGAVLVLAVVPAPVLVVCLIPIIRFAKGLQ